MHADTPLFPTLLNFFNRPAPSSQHVPRIIPLPYEQSIAARLGLAKDAAYAACQQLREQILRDPLGVV